MFLFFAHISYVFYGVLLWILYQFEMADIVDNEHLVSVY
jgi:hypothetical protein